MPASFTRALTAACAAALLAGCGASDNGSPDAAAVVNGEEIAVADVQEQVDELKANPQVQQQLQSDPSVEEQLQSDVLTTLIRDELLTAAIEERGLEVSDEDVAEVRAEVITQVGGEEAFQQLLEQQGLQEEDVEEQLESFARQEALTDDLAAEENLAVSEQELRDAYDEQAPEQGTRPARHILVEQRAEAEAIIEELESGGDFAAIARERSIDTQSGQQGGDLGNVARGQTVPPFERAVFGAEPGEIVGPVRTQFGFHVIEVTEPPTFAEQREELEQQLLSEPRQQLLNDYLVQRAADAEITVNPRFGEWDAENGRVRAAAPLGDTTEVPGAGTEPTAPGAPPATGAPTPGGPPPPTPAPAPGS